MKILTLIWTILVVAINRLLIRDELNTICLEFLSTLLVVRMANMDNGNISQHNTFFYTIGFVITSSKKSVVVVVVVLVFYDGVFFLVWCSCILHSVLLCPVVAFTNATSQLSNFMCLCISVVVFWQSVSVVVFWQTYLTVGYFRLYTSFVRAQSGLYHSFYCVCETTPLPVYRFEILHVVRMTTKWCERVNHLMLVFEMNEKCRH